MTGVVENLSDEELALFWILSDPSGIEQAEFAQPDPSHPHGVFRAYSFQWNWWRAPGRKLADKSSRSAGKSLGLTLRAVAFPTAYPGREMAIVAPQKIHLQPIVSKIEERFRVNRLGRALMGAGRNQGVKSWPPQMEFSTRSRILGRIPQSDGKGVRGLHPTILECDESQDLPDPAFMELIEALQTNDSEAQWRVHGVTNGVPGEFQKIISGKIAGWNVYRITGHFRPTWDDAEREDKIAQYGGSRHHPDYRRNVFGESDSDQTTIFLLSSLAACWNTDESHPYNMTEYVHRTISGADLRTNQRAITDALSVPPGGRFTPRGVIWMGMDVGLVRDPSEVLVFDEHHLSPSERAAESAKAADGGPGMAVPAVGASQFRLIARYTMDQVTAPMQADAVMELIRYYQPKSFAMDSTGVVLPLFQELQKRRDEPADPDEEFMAELALQKIVGYGFSSKVIVSLDDTITLVGPGDDEEKLQVQGVRRYVLEASTDVLRDLVDSGRLRLPCEPELFGQFAGQTYCAAADTEIMTRRGWQRYEHLRPDDETLGLLPTGESIWTPIEAVHVFPGLHEVIRMDGLVHRSVTTPDHRWLAKSPNRKTKLLQWRTTESLLTGSVEYIPIQATRLDNPAVPVFSDDFVALVAWYYTQGHISPGNCINLSQSPSANPSNVDLIESMLERLLGPGAVDPGKCAPRSLLRWTRSSAKSDASCHQYRVRQGTLGNDVIAVAPGKEKVVDPAFLSRLTQGQLELFIDVSLLAGGCEFVRERPGRRDSAVRAFKQKSLPRLRSFEMACVLAGKAVHTHRLSDGTWGCTLLRRKTVRASRTNPVREFTDTVWCPTTGTGTWLARYDGAVFFTGNSVSRTQTDAYGRRRRFSTGTFHALDAARMAALAWKLHPLEEMQEAVRLSKAKQESEPVPVFFGF